LIWGSTHIQAESVQLLDASPCGLIEVVRAGLRFLEEEEVKLSALRKTLDEGEASDFVEYSLDELVEELDSENR
jgi:antitoxin ParD1/3/4